MSQINNDLLFYATNQFDKTTRQALETFLADNFSPEDAIAAKVVLIVECEISKRATRLLTGIGGEISESKKGRQKKNILPKVIKDILDIWEVVDRLKGGQLLCQFIATGDNGRDSNNSISEPAQPFDLQVLVATLFDIKHLAETQTAAIKTLTNRVSNLYRHLDRTSSASADLSTSLDAN